MEIKKIKDESLLNDFKTREWPPEDKIHFGDEPTVDFDEQELNFMAVEKESILGYIKATTDTGTCEINSIIVGKDYRNKGVATALIEKVEVECKKLNIHKLWLTVGVDWDAKGLYLKLGFQEVAILKNHYGHKDFVLMEKFI